MIFMMSAFSYDIFQTKDATQQRRTAYAYVAYSLACALVRTSLNKRFPHTKVSTINRNKAKLVRTQERKRTIQIPSGGEDDDFLLTIHGYNTRITVRLKRRKKNQKQQFRESYSIKSLSFWFSQCMTNEKKLARAVENNEQKHKVQTNTRKQKRTHFKHFHNCAFVLPCLYGRLTFSLMFVLLVKTYLGSRGFFFSVLQPNASR